MVKFSVIINALSHHKCVIIIHSAFNYKMKHLVPVNKVRNVCLLASSMNSDAEHI